MAFQIRPENPTRKAHLRSVKSTSKYQRIFSQIMEAGEWQRILEHKVIEDGGDPVNITLFLFSAKEVALWRQAQRRWSHKRGYGRIHVAESAVDVSEIDGEQQTMYKVWVKVDRPRSTQPASN